MNLYSAIPQMCHILFSVVALPFLVNEIFHEFKKTTKNVLVLLANFWGGLAPHANNLIKHVYTGFFSYFTVNNVQTNRFQQLLDQLWFNLFQVNKVWLISNIKNKKKNQNTFPPNRRVFCGFLLVHSFKSMDTWVWCLQALLST